jgi:hypothetical protein
MRTFHGSAPATRARIGWLADTTAADPPKGSPHITKWSPFNRAEYADELAEASAAYNIKSQKSADVTNLAHDAHSRTFVREENSHRPRFGLGRPLDVQNRIRINCDSLLSFGAGYIEYRQSPLVHFSLPLSLREPVAWMRSERQSRYQRDR